MKQILLDLNSGKIEIYEMPIPLIRDNFVKIKSIYSLISQGTEKKLIGFGKASPLKKIKDNKDKFNILLNKIKNDGLLNAYEAAKFKLDTPIPLGYNNVGEIVEIGKNVKGLAVGDYVISNGPHSEYFITSSNLCLRIPSNVDLKEATFTIISSIALHGIRLSKPTIGEKYMVIGLGLLGQVTCELLNANGCKVIAIDKDINRVKSALENNIEAYSLDEYSSKNDLNTFDASLICASAYSSEPIDLSSEILRRKGRIIILGAIEGKFNRDKFYHKELKLMVSCSYGPGRYNKNYEEKNLDFPIEYVRWTEKRNFEAILNLIQQKKINLKKFITNIFDFSNYDNAYKISIEDSNQLGVLFQYHSNKHNPALIDQKNIFHNSQNEKINKNRKINVGVIGFGKHFSRNIAKHLYNKDFNLVSASSANGISSLAAIKKYNFKFNTTDPDEILNNEDIDTVFISTRHNTHAEYLIKSIELKKNIFIEKPLTISKKDIEIIEKLLKNYNKTLIIGYNRRFSPLSVKLKNIINKSNSNVSLIYIINSGHIDLHHWVNDEKIGGGRFISEVCHFIDYIIFLLGTDITKYNISTTKSQIDECVSITFSFRSGSIATIHYFTNGNNKLPKERLEVYQGGNIYYLNNYKYLSKNNINGSILRISQNKGYKEIIENFRDSIKFNKKFPIPLDEILLSSKILLELFE